MREDMLEVFIESALERHRICRKKMIGEEKPWTDNPIYQKYFFCNVFRQYDKCSQWMIEHIIPRNRIDLVVLYRYISSIDVYRDLYNNTDLDDTDQARAYLDKRYADRTLKFNGCFIRNPMVRGVGPVPAYRVPFHIIKELEELLGDMESVLSLSWSHDHSTLETLTEWFTQFSGTAGFMGYEYACDLEYTDIFNPTDKFTWANKGPGAQRGLSLVMEGHDRKTFSRSAWQDGLAELYPIFSKALLSEFPREIVAMREVEHWLCEFQKYVKYSANLRLGIKCKLRKYGGTV